MFRGLRVAVDMLLDEGLDNVFARHHRLAESVRRAVGAWGLGLCAKAPKWQSDTVSAIVVPDGVDANAILRHAYAAYGLSLGAGLARLNGRVFRIGHLGDLNELMVLSVLGGVELVMHDLDVAFQPGSGVAAAVDYLSSTRPGARLVAAAE
jgi:alanine-glyoxylate transaminase/serine-glyoxylate transaminase/serine-pyruvate transaminase